MAPGESTGVAYNRFKLVETLGFGRNGWVKAVKDGRKRPLLQSLDVDGNQAIPQSWRVNTWTLEHPGMQEPKRKLLW
jgi:hypothetical protein